MLSRPTDSERRRARRRVSQPRRESETSSRRQSASARNERQGLFPRHEDDCAGAQAHLEVGRARAEVRVTACAACRRCDGRVGDVARRRHGRCGGSIGEDVARVGPVGDGDGAVSRAGGEEREGARAEVESAHETRRGSSLRRDRERERDARARDRTTARRRRRERVGRREEGDARRARHALAHGRSGGGSGRGPG